MNIIQAIGHAQLQLNKEISMTDIAKAIGKSSQYVSKIKEKTLTEEQREKIENYLNVVLHDTVTKGSCAIDYLELPENCSANIKNNTVTILWLDREVIENEWKKDANNLRIIKMLGDKMNYGEHPLRNNDTLVVDISATDITDSGIYVYQTTDDDDNTYIFISGLYLLPDGSVKSYFYNPKFESKIANRKKIAEIKFKVIGRIIKNLSTLF